MLHPYNFFLSSTSISDDPIKPDGVSESQAESVAVLGLHTDSLSSAAFPLAVEDSCMTISDETSRGDPTGSNAIQAE